MRIVGRAGGAAAQRDLAEAKADGVGGARDRDEGGGAGGGDRLRGASQVEVVGQGRRKEVLVAPDLCAKVGVRPFAPKQQG